MSTLSANPWQGPERILANASAQELALAQVVLSEVHYAYRDAEDVGFVEIANLGGSSATFANLALRAYDDTGTPVSEFVLGALTLAGGDVALVEGLPLSPVGTGRTFVLFDAADDRIIDSIGFGDAEVPLEAPMSGIAPVTRLPAEGAATDTSWQRCEESVGWSEEAASPGRMNPCRSALQGNIALPGAFVALSEVQPSFDGTSAPAVELANFGSAAQWLGSVADGSAWKLVVYDGTGHTLESVPVDGWMAPRTLRVVPITGVAGPVALALVDGQNAVRELLGIGLGGIAMQDGPAQGLFPLQILEYVGDTAPGYSYRHCALGWSYGLASFGATNRCATLGTCGDGTPNAGEQCDDGNTISGDGCSASCQLESTSVCTPGDLDPSFAALSLPEGDVAGIASGLGNRIVAVAEASRAWRIDDDGMLDATFGAAGTTLVAFPAEASARLLAVATANDGRVIVAGDALASGDRVFPAVAWLSGLGQTLSTVILSDVASLEGHTAVAVTASGSVATVTTQRGAVFQIRADGTLVTTFGSSGIFRAPADWNVRRALRLPNGAVLLAGSAADDGSCGGRRTLLAARLTERGTLDSSFGAAGVRRLCLTAEIDVESAVSTDAFRGAEALGLVADTGSTFGTADDRYFFSGLRTAQNGEAVPVVVQLRGDGRLEQGFGNSILYPGVTFGRAAEDVGRAFVDVDLAAGTLRLTSADGVFYRLNLAGQLVATYGNGGRAPFVPAATVHDVLGSGDTHSVVLEHFGTGFRIVRRCW
jgi:cysteine-rich repeat protein